MAAEWLETIDKIANVATIGITVAEKIEPLVVGTITFIRAIINEHGETEFVLLLKTGQQNIADGNANFQAVLEKLKAGQPEA